MMNLVVGFEPITCCHAGCGVVFAVPSWFEIKRREDHKSFYCPNGHSQSFNSDSEKDKLRAEKLRLEASVEYERKRNERLNNKLAQEQKNVSTQKGRATRFKNERDRIKQRIANGICPCCNRHFVNVERHMTTQHPSFKIPEVDE